MSSPKVFTQEEIEKLRILNTEIEIASEKVWILKEKYRELFNELEDLEKELNEWQNKEHALASQINEIDDDCEYYTDEDEGYEEWLKEWNRNNES